MRFPGAGSGPGRTVRSLTARTRSPISAGPVWPRVCCARAACTLLSSCAPVSCVLAFAFILGACSGESASPHGSTGPTSGSGGSGTGGGGGAGGLTCEPGSHPGMTACEATLASWAPGPPLMAKRDHHTTFVAESDAGAFLYVIGGSRTGIDLDSTELAPLAEDGSVGAWAAGTALPEVMAGHMIASVGKTVVVSGGYRTGPVLSTKTEVTTIQADGTLAP